MLNIIATNKANQSLNIETNTKYQLVSATGLNPPVANINTAELATSDGSVFNVARLPQRNIVLTIQPLYGIEKARDDLYKWFSPKQPVSLEVITGSRDMKIDGYVESFEVDPFANPQVIQVSIICPEPYMRAKSDVSGVALPASVNYAADADTGAVFTVNVTGSVSSIYISNTDSSGVTQSFSMTGLTLQSGDVVTIDTRVGQKSVKLNRSGVISSLIGKVDLTSKWIQLKPGANTLSISVSNATITLKYTPLFMGI